MAEFLAGWGVSPLSGADLARRRVREILELEGIGSLAIASNGHPLIWTSYLAAVDPDRVVLLTSPRSVHGKSLIVGEEVAINVYCRTRCWGDPIAGFQAVGSVRTADYAVSDLAYSRRFPEYGSWRAAGGVTDSRFYEIVLRRVKLIDEEHFGEEVHVYLCAR